jgi:hypothetical protein
MKMATLYDADQLVFVDESSKDERTISRSHAYSKFNTRPTIKVPFVRGERWSILPALTVNGIVYAEIVEGSFTKVVGLRFPLTLYARRSLGAPDERIPREQQRASDGQLPNPSCR